MYKIIYLPEGLTVYIENIAAHQMSNRCIFHGRWKTREELEFFLQTFYFFKRSQKRDNIGDIIFAGKDLPKNKYALPKHLFEIVEFPDV